MSQITIQKGDCVFFKKMKKSSKRKAQEVSVKGQAFGILLGEVPPFAPDPPQSELIRIMGTIGFLTFDDVGEFLGDELAAKCVKAYEDKYYRRPPTAEELEVVAAAAALNPNQHEQGERPLLLDADGKAAPLRSVPNDGPEAET